MKPKEYYALTHKEYNLMCEGFFRTKIEEYKKLRQLGWWMVCGYADPKELPSSKERWWPMEGDPKEAKGNFKKTTKKRREKIENMIQTHLSLLNKK